MKNEVLNHNILALAEIYEDVCIGCATQIDSKIIVSEKEFLEYATAIIGHENARNIIKRHMRALISNIDRWFDIDKYIDNLK